MGLPHWISISLHLLWAKRWVCQRIRCAGRKNSFTIGISIQSQKNARLLHRPFRDAVVPFPSLSPFREYRFDLRALVIRSVYVASPLELELQPTHSKTANVFGGCICLGGAAQSNEIIDITWREKHGRRDRYMNCKCETVYDAPKIRQGIYSLWYWTICETSIVFALPLSFEARTHPFLQ